MPDQEVVRDEGVVAIRDWLNAQPHLPHDVDEILLRRFLNSCHRDLQRTKRTIDFFFTMRFNSPEIFANRDPNSFEIQRVFQITDMLPLPNKTKENYKVFIYRLRNPELDLFNFVDAVRTFFMLADTRMIEDDDVASGEIPIFDSANVSLKFIGKVNLSVLKKYMIYTQEAIPIRLKQVHVINSPSYIGKIHAVCKPFIKTEVAKLIKFHTPNSDTLYKDVPQELLPTEYGGQAGSIDSIKRDWIKRMESRREWYRTMDQRWAVKENLRPSNCKDAKIEKAKNLPQSFRSLSID